MSRPFISKKRQHYIPMDRVGTYLYGSTSMVARSWGFPGTLLNGGLLRPKAPEQYIPVHSEWSGTGDIPRIFNSSVLTSTRKSNGEITVKKLDAAVLRNARASRLNLTRGKGVFKTFNLPGLQIPEFTWLMPTGYLRSEISVKAFPATATFRGSDTTYDRVQTVTGYSLLVNDTMIPNLIKYWNISGLSLFSMVQLANSRAIAKVRKNDIELSVALAESRKTIDHIAKTAKSLFEVYRAMKRGNFKDVWKHIATPAPKKSGGRPIRGNSRLNPDTGLYEFISRKEAKKKFFSTKDASDRWLEFQYAWQPLLNDVNGAIKLALTEKQENCSFRVTGSCEESFVFDESRNMSSRDPEIHVGRVKRVAKTTVHYAVTDPALVFMGQAGINPLLAIWEVVPWSFVVDWFLTIGDALEAMDVSIGKEFISGTTVQFISGNCVSHMPIHPTQSMPFGWVRTNAGLSESHTDFMSYRREVLTKWPKVLPYLKNPLSTTHVLNAIALARSIRKR